MSGCQELRSVRDDLGVAVAGQIDEATAISSGAPAPSRSENITRPRVRPGVFEVRASPLRAASRLSSVDLPTFERPAMAISGGPPARQPAEVARLGDEDGFGHLRDGNATASKPV